MSNKADLHVDESEERILNDDYKNWKKSTAFLYDLVMTHALHWPSFTMEWLPSDEKDGKVEMSHLLVGATTDNDRAHVLIADVHLPNESDLDPDIPFGTYKPGLGKIIVRKRIPHMYAVTRARHMPQKSSLIATTSSNGSLNIFDSANKCFSVTNSDLDDLGIIPDDIPPSLLRLGGDCGSSATLSWNKVHPGYLLSVEEDRTIKLWNISDTPSRDRRLGSCANFEGGHSAQINDVAWWNQTPTVFLSGSSDGMIALWDIRSRCRTKPSHTITGHKKSVTSVAGSLFSKNVFASGSEDGTVALWDLRHMSMKLHSLSVDNGQSDPVLQVRWSPHSPSLVASSSQSRVISIWDLDALHDTKRQAAALPDDPPELLFVHGGHSSKITDFGWHPSLNNVIGSTANDNIVQIWKPLEHLMSETKVSTVDSNQTATVPVDIPQLPPSLVINNEITKDSST